MDRPLLRRFPYTSISFTTAIMVLLPSMLWDLSQFDLPGIDPLSIDRSEIDIIAIGFLLVVPAFFLDRAVARQRTNEDERVQFALGVARMGVWEWNLNTDAVTWSRTTASMFGLSPEEAPTTGRAFFELVHPDDRQVLEAEERAVREGMDLTSEFRTLSRMGLVRWFQSRGRVTRDTSGTPVRILGVTIDITDRKRLEEELLEARLQAEQLRILRATMRTVHDIVHNALMSLQMFRFEAEPHVPAASTALFDQIVNETVARLNALGDLQKVATTDMEMGAGIEVGNPPSKKP